MRLAFVSLGPGNLNSGSEILWFHTALMALKNGDEVLVSIYIPLQKSKELSQLKWLGAKIIYRRRYYPTIRKRIVKKTKNIFLMKEKVTYHDYLIKFSPDHIFFNLPGGNEIINDHTDLMVLIKKLNIAFSVFYHSYIKGMKISDKAKMNFNILAKKAKYNYFTSSLQLVTYQYAAGIKLTNSAIINHPLREINYNPTAINDDNIRISLIGNLVKRWKGQDLLLKTISASPFLNSLNLKINFFGDGKDKNELIELAKSLKIYHLVNFHGYSSDINYIFRETDIVIIPSRQDSGPIVLFESLKAGKLVVGAKVGAIPEYIIDGKTGFLIDDLSVKGIGETLNRVWVNRLRWNSIAKKGHTSFIRNYDFNCVQNLYDLITSK